jgi:aspartate racemase
VASLHVGIVRCSAEGAALCYRTICAEGEALLGAYARPEVSVHTPPFVEYVRGLDRGDLPGVGADARVGAEAGGSRRGLPDLPGQHDSPGPAARRRRIAAAVAAHRRRSDGRSPVARLRLSGRHGTAWLVRSRVYPEALEGAVWWLSARPRTTSRTCTA